MSTQIYSKIGKIIAPLGLLFISLLITLVWFKRGLMFAGGEEGLPLYNPVRYLEIISHIWKDANGGYPVALLLPRVPYAWALSVLFRMGIGSIVLQAGSFFILMFVGCLSVYYLFKETVGRGLEKKLGEVAAFIAAAFYLLNPYSMSQVWSRGIYAQFFAFALIPLFLFLFIRGIEKRNFAYVPLAVISSIIFSAAYVVATNAIVLWIPVLIYLGLYLWQNRKKRSNIIFAASFTIFILTLWTFSNFWWIWPTLKTSASAYSHFLEDSNNLDSFVGSSRMYFQPAYVIRLLQVFIFVLANTYGKIYLTPLFEIVSWLIPLVSAFSLTLFKKVGDLKFFVALFLIGFFISVGANPPLGGVFVWFFERISIVQAFRNSYEKAGLLLPLAYAPLFAIGTLVIAKKVGTLVNKSLKGFLAFITGGILVVAVCVVYVWPLWTGSFTPSWVGVPSYYKDADAWLSSQNGDFKIIQMPLINGDGVRYDWSHAYQGIEPGEFLFISSSIGRNVAFNKIYYNVLLERFGNFVPGISGPDPDVSKSELRSKELWEELTKLGVRYIVFHRDFDKVFMGMDPEEYQKGLDKQINIKYVKSFGRLDIYEVTTGDGIARLYSPDARVQVIKLSQDTYKARMSGVLGPTRIYLLDLYDPGWEAFIDDELVESHSRAFSYANGWIIDRSGDFEVTIKYTPQDYVATGWKVTGISLLFSGGVLIYTTKKRK